MVRVLAGLVAGLGATLLQAASAQSVGYYQSPAFNDNVMVFQSEGDLFWVAPDGGTAQRLTTHPEVESAPKLSPDGRWIAFEASYDGPTEIYLMPVTGGEPRRLTAEGGRVSVRGWLDDNTVLYNTGNIPGTVPYLLRTINITSGTEADIPLADADEAALSDDGETLFFTRFGLSMFNDHAVQYRGGRMAQLWRYTMGSDAEAVRLAADFGAPIRHPMWWNGRVYFISDKSGADNIWSMDPQGGDLRQHTRSERWLMDDSYLDNGKIAYQSGADVYVYNIVANTTSKLDIWLASDADYQRDRWIEHPLDYVESARFSPDGESVTLTARGAFVTAFQGPRRRVEYALPDTTRARSAAIGHAGEKVYAILDGGERGEIWQMPADGSGAGKALTTGSKVYVWAIWPSPHDETLLYSDKRGRLFHLDPDTGRSTLIDETAGSSDFAFGDFNWSSDGRYIAYSFYDGRDIAQVAVYDTKDKKKHVLTSGKYESFAPVFARDGKWLYFISNRQFDATPSSPWGDRNMGPAFQARGKIYALQLDPEASFPFQPDDELDAKRKAEEKKEKDEKKDSEKKKSDDEDEESKTVTIDFDGVSSRLWEVPLGSGAFAQLAASEGHLFVLEGGGSDLVYSGRQDTVLKRAEIKDEGAKLETYASDVRRFALSADASKLFVQTGDGRNANYVIADAKKDFPSNPSEEAVRLGDWSLRIDPDAEWQQMAEDAWRLHRDFAFDPNLRGVDWQAVGDHYLPMAERLGHRTELNDLLAQMSSELGILHSQIRQGEVPRDGESGDPAFLGADFMPVRNGLRIEAIWQGERDRPDTLGPLLKPGIDVRAGDVVQRVDGQPVRTMADLARALDKRAGQQVLLGLDRDGETFEEIVVPGGGWNEAMLRYQHWVEMNRRTVAEASGNAIGYLHLRAMGASDIESFARDFYEHFDKDGLIIDVRGNRGGNIDSWIMATLLRRAWAFWQGLEGGPAYTNMQQAFRGHLVVLIDEGTYSDGETFSAGVKALGLAPLIGTRTAGAGIWLSDRNRLQDGGQARVAEYAQYGMDGRWLLEGRGVSPDIEATNPPLATYRGADNQLSTALSYLKDKIAAEPIPELRAQPIPPVGTTGRDVD